MLPVLGPYEAVEWLFTVETDGPAEHAALAGVLRALKGASRPSEAVHRYQLVTARRGREGSLLLDGEQLVHSPDPGLLYATLLWHVNRGVEGASHQHVLVHAAAAERDGGAVLMSAPMDSGKTTLVAGLVDAGLGYLTDETVALRTDGTVRPYHKALSLDEGSWPLLPHLRQLVPPAALTLSREQWQVPVDAVRPDALSPGARPVVVVLPRFRAGATASLEPAPRSDTLVELMHQRFAPERAPGRDFAVLAEIVRGSDCYRLTTGRLDEAVRLMLAALDRALSRQPTHR